jgi:hypothetical protein
MKKAPLPPTRDPHLASIDPHARRKYPLRYRIGGAVLTAAAIAAVVEGADFASSLNTTAIASAEAVKGHVDGVIEGTIIVRSGNNLRTSPSTAPDINTPRNSNVGTGNIYTNRPIPEGKVFKSDFAKQITDDKGNVWYGMPLGQGFVYAEVTPLDANAATNITVNGENALTVFPNQSDSIVIKDGAPQLITPGGQPQHIPEAAFIDASQA